MELKYLDPEHIQAQLRTFSGSEHFHRLITNSPSVMTDGVRWFINQCELYEVFRRIDETLRTFVEEDTENSAIALALSSSYSREASSFRLWKYSLFSSCSFV